MIRKPFIYYTILLFVTFTGMWIIPSFVRMATDSPDSYPFVYYSAVMKDWGIRDAAIAMISVGALAFGYLIMNVFSTSSNLSGDVCSTLFGSTSILTLTKREVAICTALSVAVVVIFVLLYNKIFAVTFNEDRK